MPIPRELRLLGAYLSSVRRHWQALILGAALGSIQFLYGVLGLGWRLPAWLKPIWWVLVVAPAQYLAWRDAWEARGTRAHPAVSKGLAIKHQNEVAPGSWPSVPHDNILGFHIVETAPGALRGDLLICFDVPIQFHAGTLVYRDNTGELHGESYSQSTHPRLRPLAVERLDSRSIRVPITGLAKDRVPYRWEMWVRSPHMASIVRVERESDENVRISRSWFARHLPQVFRRQREEFHE